MVDTSRQRWPMHGSDSIRKGPSKTSAIPAANSQCRTGAFGTMLMPRESGKCAGAPTACTHRSRRGEKRVSLHQRAALVGFGRVCRTANVIRDRPGIGQQTGRRMRSSPRSRTLKPTDLVTNRPPNRHGLVYDTVEGCRPAANKDGRAFCDVAVARGANHATP